MNKLNRLHESVIRKEAIKLATLKATAGRVRNAAEKRRKEAEREAKAGQDKGYVKMLMKDVADMEKVATMVDSAKTERDWHLIANFVRSMDTDSREEMPRVLLDIAYGSEFETESVRKEVTKQEREEQLSDIREQTKALSDALDAYENFVPYKAFAYVEREIGALNAKLGSIQSSPKNYIDPETESIKKEEMGDEPIPNCPKCGAEEVDGIKNQGGRTTWLCDNCNNEWSTKNKYK